MERLKTRRNTLTVPGAIRELDKMEMTRLNGGHYLLDHALTKNQGSSSKTPVPKPN